MALSVRTAFFKVHAEKTAARSEIPPAEPLKINKGKIVLQPRFCTLRAFGEDRGGVIKARNDDNYQVSRFFQALADYIDSTRKSQDFEIISGRVAMIVFAATLSKELATGSSVFKKMDLSGIAEAGGVCLAAVACSAIFAFFSSNRGRVGRLFTLSCNTLIDSLIDQIIDGLFYDSENDDRSS